MTHNEFVIHTRARTHAQKARGLVIAICAESYRTATIIGSSLSSGSDKQKYSEAHYLGQQTRHSKGSCTLLLWRSGLLAPLERAASKKETSVELWTSTLLSKMLLGPIRRGVGESRMLSTSLLGKTRGLRRRLLKGGK